MILFTHPSMLQHRVPESHAERPARLAAVLDALAALDLDRREAPRIAPGLLTRAHRAEYIAMLERAFPDEGRMVMLDPDTFLSGGSREAAERAAGACVAAVDAVLAGEDETAFCAVRPPGHHAEPHKAMGFCIYNNVGVAAKHALDGHGLARVAVIDFDVHHGNGTQTLAEEDARLFFASTHQSPLYPGTGLAEERGMGNVLNAPLPPGAGSALWRQAMERQVLPALAAFAPELVFISAGFDAHRADPLAQMELEADDYAWGAAAIREAAQAPAFGRVVATLEGGYDLDALAESAAACVRALM